MTRRAEAPALSVVLVTYQMSRQLARTLFSLAPPCQRNLPARGVEAIVVDNGSDPPPEIGPLSRQGLDVSLHRFPSPTHSPVAAANLGLSLARGDVVAMMIDGARLASPGLVSACLAALELHPRAIAATYNYHLGLKPQHYSVAEGYDEAVEEALLASIGWPDDGYRLFEVSVPEGEEGWPSPMTETNALFMRREMWDELGGYDPAFTSIGGGFCNPDLFVRACALPEAVLVKVAGEATFHQVHGGAATNESDRSVVRRMATEYYKIRGRPFGRVRGKALLFDPRTGEVVPQG
ncbi:MAG: hypothetical protein DI565_19505 [Ancylobacter novellus]|uniref:Glycosyltransferase 2-like domain-containing protein n=1 Tax=Ancylobacter novellus TaxID=921 RepID=A0A2W5LU00_ANCNO|nr:MAG: hypothetical protein DI565_19505 [Ancylobacter novellus]